MNRTMILNRHFRHICPESLHTLALPCAPSREHSSCPTWEIQPFGRRPDGLPGDQHRQIMIDNDECYVGWSVTSPHEGTPHHEDPVPERGIPRDPCAAHRDPATEDAGADTECALTEGHVECIDENEKRVEKLLRFPNSLLDFAKVHSEKFTLNREQVDMRRHQGDHPESADQRKGKERHDPVQGPRRRGDPVHRSHPVRAGLTTSSTTR